MARRIPILLPEAWTDTVRSSVLHAVSVAVMALTRAWGAAATSPRRTARLLAELERANTEIALLKEELTIMDTRWSGIAPGRRPYFRPVQRMRILKLKAARGWSASQAAEVFGNAGRSVGGWPW